MALELQHSQDLITKKDKQETKAVRVTILLYNMPTGATYLVSIKIFQKVLMLWNAQDFIIY